MIRILRYGMEDSNVESPHESGMVPQQLYAIPNEALLTSLDPQIIDKAVGELKVELPCHDVCQENKAVIGAVHAYGGRRCLELK